MLDYIRSTGHLHSAERQFVFEQRNEICWIEKLHGSGHKVRKVGPPSRMKSSRQIAREVCELLQERIGGKMKKLKHVLGPKILLILDAYRFADRDMYTACLPELSSSLAGFHTVFIVRTGSAENFALVSKEAHWCR